MNPPGRKFIYIYTYLCAMNYLTMTTSWLRHCKTWSHLVFIFFLLCVGSLEVKYLFVNVLFINIRKKQRERNTPMRNICFASKWNIFLYINIYIQITLWKTERKLCFLLYLLLFVVWNTSVLRKKYLMEKLQKTSKGKKTSFSQHKPHIKLKSQIFKENP